MKINNERLQMISQEFASSSSSCVQKDAPVGVCQTTGTVSAERVSPDRQDRVEFRRVRQHSPTLGSLPLLLTLTAFCLPCPSVCSKNNFLLGPNMEDDTHPTQDGVEPQSVTFACDTVVIIVTGPHGLAVPCFLATEV